MMPEQIIEIAKQSNIEWDDADVCTEYRVGLSQLQAFAQLVRNAALAEPAVEPVTRISLKDGKYLNLEPFYFLGPVCWILYTENDKQIRALDKFESGFVNAALNKSPPPPAEVPLLTERELIDLFGGYGGLHTTQLMQFRIVEQAVRQKAGL